MTRQFGVVALAFCFGTGVACSSGNGGGGQTGGNAPKGGSAVATGGSATGGSPGSGSGGASVPATDTGGNATGGQAGAASGGGTSSSGSSTGGAAGSTSVAGGSSTTSDSGRDAGAGGSGGLGSGGIGSGGATGGSRTGGTATTGAQATGGAATGGTTGASGGTSGAATGGSASGGTGSTGTGGQSTGAVVPTKVSGTNKYRFASGDLVFEVDAGVGARVATFSLAGANMVVPVPAGTDNTTWGSVFWIAPRSLWTPSTWPPPSAFDGAAYTGGPSGNHLVLDGPTDTSIGVSFSKDYSMDETTGWVTIVYTVKATKAIKAAPWEDTRTPRGGIAFFPAGSSLTKGPLTMTTTAGINWFDDAPKTASSPDGSKAYGDGKDGWSAYAVNGLLLLKKFTDLQASALAPSEGEVDIYPGVGFLEVEVLGPYTSLAAGATMSLTVQWRLVKIPSSVTVSVGSTTLVDFAKQQVGL